MKLVHIYIHDAGSLSTPNTATTGLTRQSHKVERCVCRCYKERINNYLCRWYALHFVHFTFVQTTYPKLWTKTASSIIVAVCLEYGQLQK